MPFYPHECKKCGHNYDIWSATMQKKEETCKKAKCEKCGSKSKKELLAIGGFKFTNPIGTDRYNNSHDYRHKWNVDRTGGVRDQRKYAEKNSHVGPNPYNEIDDISSGKYFGEVK